MQKKARLHKPTRVREMTQSTAQLIVDLLNVEGALHLRGDREGLFLAAALAVYRRQVEKQAGFVRRQPDHSLEALRFAEVRQGRGWLKLIDTRDKLEK